MIDYYYYYYYYYYYRVTPRTRVETNEIRSARSVRLSGPCHENLVSHACQVLDQVMASMVHWPQMMLNRND